MCEPVTLTLAGIALAGSAYSGMQAQKAAYANAATNEQNAQVADMAAGAATDRGQVVAERVLQQGTETTSKAKSQIAAAGADVQSGSAVDVQAGSEGKAALDAATVVSNATREAWGYKVEGAQFRRRAALDRLQGDNAVVAGVFGGVTRGAEIAAARLRVS